MRTRILAASIRSRQVLEQLVSICSGLAAGLVDVTLPPALLQELLADPVTAAALARFADLESQA